MKLFNYLKYLCLWNEIIMKNSEEKPQAFILYLFEIIVNKTVEQLIKSAF